jgi:ABC-2 type transport system ATP-binding protein
MIIESQNLTKRFGGLAAVDNVSLSVPEGAIVALAGANGAGKTTMLRVLMNILQADSGQARVLGVGSQDLRAAEYARIGYVSENTKLPLGLNVEQFFAYLRRLYPTWDGEREAGIRRQFDLPADRKLGQLSRGMRIKAALASVLPYRPTLLVLDEPLSGLDVLVRDEVLEGLLANVEETTILISSHELAELEGCATHIAFMDKGKLVMQDSLEDMSARFRDVTAGFADEPARAVSFPKTWLSPEWSGRTLRFAIADYTSDDDLSRSLSSLIGSPVHLSTQPMSLREMSKALMRAYRSEARQ